MQPPGLYEAILARHSTRRYDGQRLPQETLERVRALVCGVESLVPGNLFVTDTRNDLQRRDLTGLLGAYGLFLTPPHALIPYAVGDTFVLQDLGYRVEQIVIELTRLGLSSCYVGTLSAEEKARSVLGLPAQARIGAIVVYGLPAAGATGRGVNRLIRSSLSAGNRLPMERIFYAGDFDTPASPPARVTRLIEAARHAPSACNAQPWRFLWQEPVLSLFVLRHNRKYGPSGSQSYRYYDAGICMANVAQTMKEYKLRGGWDLYRQACREVPSHPPELEPVARLLIEGS